MPRDERFGLALSFGEREAAGNAERIKAVQIAAGRQDFRRADQIATRRRAHEAAIERMDQRAELIIVGERVRQRVGIAARAGGGDRLRPVPAFFGLGRLAQHVQAMRNQLALNLVEPRRQRLQIDVAKIDRRSCGLDHRFQPGAFIVLRRGAPAFEQRLQLGQPLVQPAFGERRGEVADQRRARTALGDQPF